MRKIDGIRNRVAVILHWVDADELAAFAHFQLFADAHVAAFAALLLHANALHHVHERLCASIQDWKFQIVDLDDGVIDAGSDERAQQMFRRRDEYTLLHQAGGVADARDVAPRSLDLEIVEIHPTENDSSPGRCGKHSQLNRSATVQA